MPPDSRSGLRFVLMLAMLATPAYADEGDDMVNNLITDLAPLIALFGERVVMQFLSQSLGLADCVALAVAPIGIITIVVSAIRVGGPRWLKAIIGRARENTAAAEAELMSSTSKETCELWNGDSMVRCQGSGKVWQFICLVPNKRVDAGNPYDIECMSLEEATGAPFGDGNSGEPVHYLKEANVTASSRLKQWLLAYPGAAISSLFSFLNCRGAARRCPPSDPEAATSSSVRTTDSQKASDSNLKLRSPRNSHPSAPAGAQQPSSQDSPAARAESTHGPAPKDRVIVVRDPSKSAPNLALNCHDRPRRREIILTAIAGILLQTGVLIWCAFSVREESLAKKLKKNDKDVKEYAPFLTIIGTLLLTVGLLACGWVVEHSTKETFYEAVDGYSIYLVWLQQGGAVNDQDFKPFAICPVRKRSYFSISRREEDMENKSEPEKASDHDSQRHASQKASAILDMELWTVSGCAIALTGFFLQFTGLRGMNYSVSIAQFLAMVIMTCARAFIRRGLVVSPFSKLLPPDTELDWFARTFETASPCWMNEEAWLRSERDTKAANDSMDLGATTTMGGTAHHAETIAPASSIIRDDNAQQILSIRRQMAKLSDFRGPFSNEAILLAEAVEAVAAELLHPSLRRFAWQFEVMIRGKLCSFSFELKYVNERWRARSDDFEALLSLWVSSLHGQEEAPKVSEVSDDDGWLRSQQPKDTGLRLYGPIPNIYTLLRDFRFWLPEDVKVVLEVEECTGTVSDLEAQECIDVASHRVVGDDPGYRAKQSQGRRRFRVLRAVDMIEVNFDKIESEADMPLDGLPSAGLQELTDSRIVQELIRERMSSSNTTASKTRFLAIRNFDTLEHLFARHVLFDFVKCVGKERVYRRQRNRRVGFLEYPESTCESATDWVTFKMNNPKLTIIAQTVATTGFLSLRDAWLDIVAPLSIAQDLAANSSVIFRHLRNKMRESLSAESLEDFHKAFKALFELALMLEANGAMLAPQALALCHYYSGMFSWAITTASKEHAPDHKWRKQAEKLRAYADGYQKFFSQSLDPEHGPWSVFKDQFPMWRTETYCPPKPQHLRVSETERIKFQLSEEHVRVMSSDAEEHSRIIPTHLFTRKQQDVFQWTPLHYHAAMGDSPEAPKPVDLLQLRLLRYVSDVDIFGFYPLHHACARGRLAAVKQLLSERSPINDPQEDGILPMHLAAASGSVEIIRLLQSTISKWQASQWIPYWKNELAMKQELDFNGRTPAHWAAIQGHVNVVRVLDRDKTDKYGWNCLHLAVMHQRRELVEWLMENDNKLADAPDNIGRIPLHFAVVRPDIRIVEMVALRSSFLDRQDAWGAKPLHTAAKNGNSEVVQMLVKFGANINESDGMSGTENLTPFEYAMRNYDLDCFYAIWRNISSEQQAALVNPVDGRRSFLFQVASTRFKGEQGLKTARTVVQIVVELVDVEHLLYDWAGESVLCVACKTCNIAVVEALLGGERKGRASLLVPDEHGETPLQIMDRMLASEKLCYSGGSRDTAVAIRDLLLEHMPVSDEKLPEEHMPKSDERESENSH